MQKQMNRLLKSTYNFSPVLHNRGILYAFFVVALFELVYFLTINDYYSFSTLILIGLLTSFFNKNMTVILFIAIVFTHILKYWRSSYTEGMDGIKDIDGIEGMESMEGKSDDEVKTDTKDKKKDPSDDIMDQLSKIKDHSEKISKLSVKDEKSEELIDGLNEMKDTRKKIIENLQTMQPLLQKFESFKDKFQNYKESLANK